MRDIGYSELAGCETNGGNPHIQDTWQHLWRNGPEQILPQGLGRLRKLVIDVLMPKGYKDWT